ncbi:MAG TPA: MFS transporter [Streptosporangiaceae bacterium]|nr:MFS transporter [Streptosporangiaceae bacterium]
MRPAQTASPVSPPPPPPLWRNLRFQALWIGMTSSTLGVSVADIAYPLVILIVTGSPAQAGLFAAVQAFAMLAAGLPAGSLADRFDPRQIVMVTETCRALVTSLVVIALITGWLSLPLLLAAGALLGIGQGTCNPARILLLYAVVPGEQLTVALAQDQVRTNGASMAGPALGGALYSIRALSHAVPFVFTAVSFVISLATTALMPKRTAYPKKEQAEPQAGTSGDGGMLAGLRFVWRHPVLRPAMVLIAIVNTVGVGLDLILIVLLRHQGVPSSEIGFALGVAYAGSIVGIPLIKVLHRIRPGVLMISIALLLIPIFALLSVPLGPWWAAGLLFVALLSLPAVQVAVEVLGIKQTPEEQRGRVAAAFMTLIALGVPVGLAGCGLLLQYLPAQVAMLTLAAILAAGVGYCAARPGLWQARWPD